MTSIVISIGICIIISGLLYIILVQKIEHAKSEPEVLKKIRAEINQMIVELNQTADRNIGLVEERIRRLNILLEQSDQKIRLLQGETGRYTQSVETYSKMKPKNILPLSQGTNRENASPSGRGEMKPVSEPVQEKSMSKRDKIITLYKQGISTNIIASRVDSTVAEVELIISINEDKKE